MPLRKPATECLRRATQRERILNLLQFYARVANHTLGKISYRYGARIHELRKKGYSIKTIKGERGVTYYELRGEPDGASAGRFGTRDKTERLESKV